MSSRSVQSRLDDMKSSVKGLIAVGQQRLGISTPSARQEHLNTNNMIKVLVIGETGSGKSTFINYLTNFFKKGTLDNLKVAIPSKFHSTVTENFEHHEHDLNDKTQSKTDSCNQYMFTDGTSQYLFLDTPGLSDTRGAEQDKVNLTKIIDAVEVLSGLTAVIIVVNGAIARLTVNLRNVIAQLRGNLPDIVMDNVIVVLTNTSRHTANFTLDALELNGNVYPYYMQNSAFSTDPDKWTSTAMVSLRRDWDQAMSELKAMTTTLNTFKTKSVSAFKNMKDIRNAIKSLMHAARVEVTQIQKMQDEIAMFEAGLKQADSDTVTYKDYTKERIVDKVELVDAAYHSTLCQNCNHVCHDNCGLNETTAVGAQIFQQCWAMSGGNCSQCQHKCSYTAHYHAKKTVKNTKQTLKDVLADIKSRYDAASKDSANFKQKITNTADAKKLLEKALKQKNAEIIAKCNELRQICSGFNLAAELHALIDQLEVESAMLRNLDAKKQAEAFIRSLKDFCASIERDQDAQQTKREKSIKMNIINTEQHVEGQTPMSYEPTATANVSNQNSNTPVTNAASYASDDVLNQIRAISGNASKKKKSKLQETSPENKESTDDDHSDSDSSDILIPTIVPSKPDKKKPSKIDSSRAGVISTKPDVEEFKKLRTTELLTRYQSCEDQRIRNFIINELTQRSLGKSMAPLADPADICTFTASTQKYCSLDYNSLKYAYEQLKEQICAITEPDILEIEKVPSVLLSEIAAVYQLLKSTPAIPNPAARNLMPHTQQHPMSAYPQHQSMPYYPQQFQPSSYQQQPPPFHQQPYQQPRQQSSPFHQQPHQQPYEYQQPHQQPYHYQQPYQQNYSMSGATYPPTHMPQPSHLPPNMVHGRESVQNLPPNTPYGRESIQNVPSNMSYGRESVHSVSPNMMYGRESVQNVPPNMPYSRESIQNVPPNMSHGRESVHSVPPNMMYGRESVQNVPSNMAHGRESVQNVPPNMPYGRESVQNVPSNMAHDREPVQNAPRQYDNFSQHDSQYYKQIDQSGGQYSPAVPRRDNEYYPRDDTNSLMHNPDLNSNLTAPPPYYPNQYHHPQENQQIGFRNVAPTSSAFSPSMMVRPSPSAASHLPDTFDRMRVSSPFRPIDPSNHQSDMNLPRSRSSSSFSELNSRTENVVGLPSDLSLNELRKCTDNVLLSAYNDATQKKNRFEGHAIYSELQRRCDGDHPQLINENQALYNEKYNSFQNNSLDDLKQFQLNVKTKIREYLTNGDASNINNIPHELIIEAAVLDHLINRKPIQK